MAYITEKDVTDKQLVCSHPRVKHIWQYGALSLTGKTGVAEHVLAIIIDDETRAEFNLTKDYAGGIAEAEKWLSELK